MSTTLPNRFLFALLGLFLISACSLPTDGTTATVQLLRPGDTWAGMTLMTGGAEATSVWEVCQPAYEGGNPPDCRVPAVPLAIGPSAAALSEPVNLAEWSQFVWTMVVDGKPIALDAFGTFDFTFPRKAASGRDALFVYQAWDVVLAAPTPGPHTLQGTVTRLSHPGKEVGTLTETMAWAIDLVVE